MKKGDPVRLIGAYLACPYSHPDPSVSVWRYERVTEATALLVQMGYDSVFSPITHSHPLDKHLTQRNNDHDFWVNKFDLPFLENSEELLVLMLPGWQQSTGVQMERKQATDRYIPVRFVVPGYDAAYRITDLRLIF
jgi:hypothetical protein